MKHDTLKKSGGSQREYVLRVRFTPEEMDQLTAAAKSLSEREGLKRTMKQGQYVRRVVLGQAETETPRFPPVAPTPTIERPIRLKIRLSLQEDEDLNELVDDAAKASNTDVQTERYVRWRLFGVLK